jgi:beta-lactamase regulating signal transducer with metallopeptidase domain
MSYSAMINMILISAATGIAVFIVCFLSKLVGKHFDSRWRYWLWLILGIRLILPFPIFISNTPIQFQINGEKIIVDLSETQDDAGVNHTWLMSDSMNEPTVADNRLSLKEVLIRYWFPVWIIGAVLFIAYHGVKNLLFYKRILRWKRPLKNTVINKTYKEIYKELNIKKPPPVRVCEVTKRTCLIGIFKPFLILPNEILSCSDISHLLRHELTHYHRKDMLYKLFILIVNALHWFNPSIYLLRFISNRDIELLCDLKTTKNYNTEDKKAYGKLIINLAAMNELIPSLSTGFNRNGKVLKYRVQNIFNEKRKDQL